MAALPGLNITSMTYTASWGPGVDGHVLPNDPLAMLEAGRINLRMELQAQGPLVRCKGLVRADGRGGQRGHAGRQLELVAMPVQHRLVPKLGQRRALPCRAVPCPRLCPYHTHVPVRCVHPSAPQLNKFKGAEMQRKKSMNMKRRKSWVDPLFEWSERSIKTVMSPVCGSGHHLQRTGKHIVCRIHHYFKMGILKVDKNFGELKNGFATLSDKTGYFCGVGRTVVEKAVADGNRGYGWADPKPRGGQPWESIDVAPHDQIAAVRNAHAALATKLVPTSAIKIKKYLEEYQRQGA